MKEIKAIIRPNKLPVLRDALVALPGFPGMTVTRVVGVLRPVNIGSFNVWIIYPRDSADLTL